MLTAMMSPTLIGPMRYIQLRGFVRRRARSITLFVIGYAALWMSVGCLLLGLQWFLEVIAPESYLPGMVVFFVTIAWQCSPIKQRCLNRSHAHVELAAFGLSADFSMLRFGIIHGLWCAGSCWAMMFTSMLLPRWHIFSMAMCAVLIGCERLERPQSPSWRPRGLGKVMRFALAQLREHLTSVRLPGRPLTSGRL